MRTPAYEKRLLLGGLKGAYLFREERPGRTVLIVNDQVEVELYRRNGNLQADIMARCGTLSTHADGLEAFIAEVAVIANATNWIAIAEGDYPPAQANIAGLPGRRSAALAVQLDAAVKACKPFAEQIRRSADGRVTVICFSDYEIRFFVAGGALYADFMQWVGAIARHEVDDEHCMATRLRWLIDGTLDELNGHAGEQAEPGA